MRVPVRIKRLPVRVGYPGDIYVHHDTDCADKCFSTKQSDNRRQEAGDGEVSVQLDAEVTQPFPEEFTG